MPFHQADLRMLFLQLVTFYFAVCQVHHVVSEHGVCNIRLDDPQGLTVDCSHLGLSEVPSNLPNDTRSLDLSVNNITSLDNNVFSSLKQLYFLDLSINPLEFLSVQTFAGLEALHQLDMYGHGLNYSKQSLPYDVFKPLQRLQVLNIRSSLVQSPLILPDQALKHLGNLTVLNIDTASRTYFGQGFAHLQKLNSLNIKTLDSHGMTFRCGLNFITNDTFKMFAKLPIQSLFMHDCNCIAMERSTKLFEYFPDLITLNVEGATLVGKSVNDILRALSQYGKPNKTFSSIHLRHYRASPLADDQNYNISSDIILPMCIHHLDISDLLLYEFDFGELLTFPPSRFSKCLKHFLLSENHLNGKFSLLVYLMMNVFLPSLEIVDISDQNTHSLMLPHFRGYPDLPSLPVGLPMILSPNLTYLNLAGAIQQIGIYPALYMFNGQQLTYLNLSYTGLYRFHHPTIGIENLQVLDISGNDCRIITDNFFDTLPNLTTLAISNALLDNNYIMRNGSRLLSPLTKLESLDLSYNDLTVLPNNLFNSFTALRNINLRNNRLISVPDVHNLFNLKSISLISNSLTILQESTTRMFDKMAIHNPNVTIFLDKNVFSCGCIAFKFLLWLKETHVNLDGRNYSCIDMSGNLTTTMSVYYKYTTYHRKCISGMWLTLSTSGLSFMVISILVAFLVVKNKAKLKLLLDTLKGRNIYPNTKDTRDKFKYDACVIYPNSCYRLARVDMVLELEENRRLKLNLSDRDHLLGHHKLENIYKAMDDSWKIILIWTGELFRDELIFNIMCYCLLFITPTTPQRVIIVFDTNFESPAYTSTDFFLKIITKENILRVDLRGGLDAPFWNRLFNSITYREPDH